MKTEAVMEGILFAMGGPVEKRDLALAMEISEEEVEEAAARLRERCGREERGIQLLVLEDSYQLATKPACYGALIRLAAHPKKPVLTGVQLETLAIIAYRQPVTKLEISKIRGVSSDHAVNKLIEYDLVRETGRMDAPGRPILLGTTQEFLRRFGLSSVKSLPEPDAEKLAELAAEAERETADAPENTEISV